MDETIKVKIGLLRQKLSIKDTANKLGLSNRTVERYSNYKIKSNIKKEKVKTKNPGNKKAILESEFHIEDQELFNQLYDYFIKYQWFNYGTLQVSRYIQGNWTFLENYKYIKKWPGFNYKKEIITRKLVELFFKRYTGESNANKQMIEDSDIKEPVKTMNSEIPDTIDIPINNDKKYDYHLWSDWPVETLTEEMLLNCLHDDFMFDARCKNGKWYWSRDSDNKYMVHLKKFLKYKRLSNDEFMDRITKILADRYENNPYDIFFNMSDNI